MDSTRFSRWLFAPLAGAVAAGALVISGGFSSAQTPADPNTQSPDGSPTPDATQQMSEMPNYDEILAEELDISVEELREARSNAQEQYIDDLVDEEVITEEQAEQLKNWNPIQAIQDAIAEVNPAEAREFIVTQMAEILDMERDALEEDLSEGMTLNEIAEEQNVDLEELRTNLQEQAEQWLDMAVQADILSEEQAQTINDLIDKLMNAIVGEDSEGLDDMLDMTPESGSDSTPEADETPTDTTP